MAAPGLKLADIGLRNPASSCKLTLGQIFFHADRDQIFRDLLENIVLRNHILCDHSLKLNIFQPLI